MSRKINPFPSEPHPLGKQPLPLLGVQMRRERPVRPQHPMPRHRAVIESKHSSDDARSGSADVLGHVAVGHNPTGRDRFDTGEDSLREFIDHAAMMKHVSRYPIVQAPMAGGPSTPELAAAVNAAGGFGSVAAGYLSPDALRGALARTRELSAQPISVNLFVPGSPDADGTAIARYSEQLRPLAARFDVELGEPRWEDDAYEAKLELVATAGVRTVSFTFGCPDPTDVRRLKQSGARVAVTVTSRVEAEAAAAAGADTLIVQGTEAGGHQGTHDPSRPNRTPLHDALKAIQSLDLAMIAAGGIMSAADARAAFEHGAGAVQLGTALLCTPEAGTSAPHRAALLNKTYPDTMITRAFSGRWARGLANRFAREHPDAPDGYPQLHHLTRPLRAAATKRGDPDVPNLWAGTGWQQISTVPAGDVVRMIASGCR